MICDICGREILPEDECYCADCNLGPFCPSCFDEHLCPEDTEMDYDMLADGDC